MFLLIRRQRAIFVETGDRVGEGRGEMLHGAANSSRGKFGLLFARVGPFPWLFFSFLFLASVFVFVFVFMSGSIQRP